MVSHSIVDTDFFESTANDSLRGSETMSGAAQSGNGDHLASK